MKNNLSIEHKERCKFSRTLFKSHCSLFNQNDISNAVEVFKKINQNTVKEYLIKYIKQGRKLIEISYNIKY